VNVCVCENLCVCGVCLYVSVREIVCVCVCENVCVCFLRSVSLWICVRV